MADDIEATETTENGQIYLGRGPIAAEDEAPVVDKAALLGGRAFGVTSVPIPGMGVIKVRPLSRAEALKMYAQEIPAAEMEQTVISLACVEPTFTKREVAQWQASSAAGEMIIIVNAILELSGMDIGAGKAAYKRFRGAS
jgi:hypothetical protein